MVTWLNLATQSEAPDSDVFSFKLVGTLKSDCLEIGWIDKNNALSAGVSGAPLIALEKRKERFIRTPGRAHNRIRSPRLAASCHLNKVGKGSRQIRSVTLGKGLALRVGYRGPCSDVWTLLKLLDASGEEWLHVWLELLDKVHLSRPFLCDEQLTLNWSKHGESDCLIKTKHCDGLIGFWYNVISAQCSECQSEEIQTSAGKRRE